MSHIVEIRTQVRDLAALRAACQRLGLREPEQATVQLYSASATGHCVALPGWRYPAVFQLRSGEVKYDNFSGHWGSPAELERLFQNYAVEKAKLEARKQGHSVSEQLLADGSIKLLIAVGGVA